jgi:formate dehydrogenase major subunit
LNYTDMSFIVKDEFAFRRPVSGYDADKRSYDKSSWDYASVTTAS